MTRSMFPGITRRGVAILQGIVFSALLFASAGYTAGKGEEKKEVKHLATLSPLAKPPKLDGKLAPGEWDNATGTVNFLANKGKLTADYYGMHMDLREGKTLVGYRGNTLYIAVVSALPPRGTYGVGRFSREMARDSKLIADFNAVEIWLDPNRDNRETKKGSQAFYQFFVNSVGSLLDAKVEPGHAPDKGWNTKIQTGNHIDLANKIWTTEIAIDMEAMGWSPGTAAGRSMGVLVSRNYKAPWNQATWFPHGGAFVSWYLYPQIRFRKDEVVARVDSLGDLWDEGPTFKVKLFNPGKECKAKVALKIVSSDMPNFDKVQTISLPAKGKGEFSVTVLKQRLHHTADHLFNVQVVPEGKKEATFNYTGMWSRNPRLGGKGRGGRRADVYPFEQKWAFRAEAAPQQSVLLKAYPSYNLIRVELDATKLVADPGGKDKDRLSSSADVTVSFKGKEIARKKLSWDAAKKIYVSKHNFKLDDLAAGEYTITAAFDKHDKPVVKTYTRTKYVWEGNTIGITDKIYPPFTAVEATDTVTKVVGRRYGVGDLGLWNSVRSLDKEILAGPIVLRADHDRIFSGKPKKVAATPMRVTREASAKDPAVTVRAKTVTEIDGVMKLTLTLLPGTERSELKHLSLDIPLKAESAPLWHAVTTAIRVNPMGKTPAGEGVVWDSRKFPNGDWIGNFVPYIWLGGIKRGLCVFANNDQGWVQSWNKKKEFAPAQELIRKGDTITIRLNLVQKPITIDKPRTIVLGLMASPGKPIPYKDWRGITAWGTNLGKGFEHLPRHIFDMGWSVETVYSAAYPYNRDYSVYEATMKLPGTPGGDMVLKEGWKAFFADYKKRNGLDKPVEQLTSPQRFALGRTAGNRGSRKGLYNGNYWDEYNRDYPGHPETRVFNGEWAANMARSRQDFRCYHGAETVKRGIGLYFDNVFPHLIRDTITTDAYEIPGIGIQPSAQLWEQRDYHRRIWNIHRKFGAAFGNKPMAMMHMTNTNMIPVLTWNDMNCDLEWFYGPEPQQSKYSLEMLQAETCGLQSGCVPFAFARIENVKTAEQQRIAERTRFGSMMVHDVKLQLRGAEEVWLTKILYGFGYGRRGVVDGDDVETVYNYWDEDFPIVSSNELVKSLLVKRGKELLLLVTSWDKNPGAASLRLDTKAIGLSPAAASDAEGTPAEQVAVHRSWIQSYETKVAQATKRLAAAEKKYKKDKNAKNAARLKKAKEKLNHAARTLEQAEAILSTVEKEAKLPIRYNARTGKLEVEMVGYGVRLIKLR